MSQSHSVGLGMILQGGVTAGLTDKIIDGWMDGLHTDRQTDGLIDRPIEGTAVRQLKR